MVGVINPPCTGNGINSSGSYSDYQEAAELVTSVGPLPSVVQGGQLVSTYPTGTPTGSPGPSYTGFSASCTVGLNTSSNLTASTTISTLQPTFIAGSGCVYSGISFRYKELPSLVWQAGSRFGLVVAVLLALTVV
jgi:hypothetical protein